MKGTPTPMTTQAFSHFYEPLFQAKSLKQKLVVSLQRKKAERFSICYFKEQNLFFVRQYKFIKIFPNISIKSDDIWQNLENTITKLIGYYFTWG